MKTKKMKKHGLAALLITGTVVGIGMGATHVVKRLAQQRQNQKRLNVLKNLKTKSLTIYLNKKKHFFFEVFFSIIR